MNGSNGNKGGRGHMMGWLAQAFGARQQRMRLEELDDHLLRDIGVEPNEAHREAVRPFWDLH